MSTVPSILLSTPPSTSSSDGPSSRSSAAEEIKMEMRHSCYNSDVVHLVNSDHNCTLVMVKTRKSALCCIQLYNSSEVKHEDEPVLWCAINATTEDSYSNKESNSTGLEHRLNSITSQIRLTLSHTYSLIDSTRCGLLCAYVLYIMCSAAQFLRLGVRIDVRMEPDKLITELWATSVLRPAATSLCGLTDVTHFPHSPLPHHHPHHHQLLTSACTYQNSRPFTWIVLEGSYWSLPRLTSFQRLSYILMWRHCLRCGFVRTLMSWDFDVTHSGNIVSVF